MPDPRRDEKGLNRLWRYLEKPRTIRQIQTKFNLSEPTAYRWIRYLRSDGVDVVTRSEGRIKKYARV